MRIFIEKTDVGKEIFISGDDARHIFAHRPQKNDFLSLSDGKDFLYDGEISDIKRDGLSVLIKSKTPFEKEDKKKICFQALLKGDKNEFVIQKATELGISEIVFFSSDFCVSKIEEKKLSQKKERFEKVAKLASMQSERKTVPEIRFTDFDGALELQKNGIFFYERAENENFPLLSKFLSENKINNEISFFVGPEGGFSEKEISKAKEKLFVVSLGKRILRAETVAIVSLSVINSFLGEI